MNALLKTGTTSRHRALTLLLVLLCWLPTLQAHMLNMTRMEASLGEGRGEVTLRIDLGQSLMTAGDYWRATRLPADEQPAALQDALTQLERQLQVMVDGQPLPLTLATVDIKASSLAAIANPLTPQMATLRYTFTYPATGDALAVRISENLEVPWPFLVRVDRAGVELPVSRLLTNVDRRTTPVPLNDVGATGIAAGFLSEWLQLAPALTWVAVGFQHIVPDGLDHMLFILGLFFLAAGWRALLWQVTAFTLAHSLTLGLTMLGVVSAPAHIIEPLIALSIVYVAVDNLFAHKLARFRLLVVTAFGLLHGMGFASVLAEIGLPQESFLLSLALFNLGVEFGQVAVLLAAFLVVGWWRRQTWYQQRVAYPATIAIAGTGAYWLIRRIAL